MKSSAHAMSELMAGSMTTTGRTMDVTARLTYVPRDPHVITVTITDRAGAVPIWTIGRDLLLGGLIARASCPAGMGQIRLWTGHRWGRLEMPVRSERNAAAAAVPVCLLDEGCGW
jgi:hypothetical protein